MISKINSFIVLKKNRKIQKNPKQYHFKIEDRIIRQVYNSAQSFFIYFLIALVLNILGFILFNLAEDKSDITSLLAISCLFLTVATRNYSVNYFLFHTLGNLVKNYLLDQLANKIGFLHRFMAISTLFWTYLHFSFTDTNNLLKNSLILILIFLLIIILTAFAGFRRKHHDIFENIHRYLGYTTIFILIVYYFKLNSLNGLAIADIVTKPHFILLTFIVIMLITPWVGVKNISKTIT